MKLILVILGTSFILAGCSSQSNYRATDYANACVQSADGKKSSHLCMPIDTYENKIKFHSMRPSEMRKMPTMSDVMD